MQNFLKSVLGAPCKIEIELDQHEERTLVEVTTQEGKSEKLPLFFTDDAVKGVVHLRFESGTKKVEHLGIKVALVGSIS